MSIKMYDLYCLKKKSAVTNNIHSYYNTLLNVQIYKPTNIFVPENLSWPQHGWKERSEII